MFTGIISDIGTITKSEQSRELTLEISCGFTPDKLGESIACNGVCLTVIAINNNHFTVQLSTETLSKTGKDSWQQGKKLNLERALKLGDTLDGHLVSGHVDGVAKLLSITPSGDSHILTLLAPTELAKFIATKGSVTLDGISLTVNHVDNEQFTVNIIPHTWQHTTIGNKKTGDEVNIEIDMLARYTARILGK